MLIALGFNQQTTIAALFLVLALILGGITAASLLFRKLDGAFEGLMFHSKAYVFFGILTIASFTMFLVETFQ